jgi:uncharacterized flavoprotein (TIGR03862 family)
VIDIHLWPQQPYSMNRAEGKQIAVVGGGPAGLFAAETAASAGAAVTLFEAKASVGRKFLVAGRGGLNLTHSEPLGQFPQRYSGPEMPAAVWKSLLMDFDNQMIREWAAGLGIETFQASSGRIYPMEMKAAPLLRRWVARLRDLGVALKMHSRLVNISTKKNVELTFATAQGEYVFSADAVILALGGGSWPVTGSDGKWLDVLESFGVAVHPLVAANCGWEVAWPEHLVEKIEGQPLKNIKASAAGQLATGELMLTRYGIEGGIIYQLGNALRGMDEPVISVDLKPDFSTESLLMKMESAKKNQLVEAKIRWRLSAAAHALLVWRAAELAINDVESLSFLVKNLRLPVLRPRPLAEAISSAGGVRWTSIDEGLALNKHPNVFVAGEMIDWEAPTGGYLMQGCFASGHRAAISALAL